MTPTRFKLVFGVFMLFTFITLVLDQLATREDLLENLKDQLSSTTYLLSEILSDDHDVNVMEMQTLVENVRRSPHYVVGIVDTQWNVLVRHPKIDTLRVARPHDPRLLDFIRRDISESVMKLPGMIDGRGTRWISIRKVRGKPYMVYAADSEMSALPHWYKRLGLYSLLYLLMGVGVVVLYRYQARLLRSENKIRTLLDEISEIPVQGYKPDGTVLYWNKASETLYGYTADELMGRNIYDHIVPEENEQEIRDNAERIVKTGKEPTAKLWLLNNKNGEKFHVLTHYILLDDDPENPEIFCFDVNLEPMTQAQKQVEDLLKEKDMLLREVHHRIKNNMSTISGLLWLQAETLENTDAAQALTEAHGRVQNMMVLYDQLYRSAGFDKISSSDYLSDLVEKITSTSDPAHRIIVETDFDDVQIDAKKLLSIGMIVNELLGNVYKYAFPGRLSGIVRISARKEEEAVMVLTIEDNGTGLPVSVIETQCGTGFGMTLVTMLNDQLNGRMEMANTPGASFVFRFPI